MSLSARISSTLAHWSEHHCIGRYSVDKLVLFDDYLHTASTMRVAAVIALAPLPTLLALIAMDIVPMNSPDAGPRSNTVAFVRSTVSHAVMTFFTLLPLKQALNLSDRDYSLAKIALIACCVSLTVESLCISLAFTWRFPVPFREFIGLPLWMASVCGYNYVFAHRVVRRMWRRWKLQLYVPIAGVQVTLFYLFLGLSVGFSNLSLAAQTAMIATFPLVKIVLKRLVWKYARALDDISTDVSICMLEVSGALYQTVCMQFVTSRFLSGLVMVSDVVQAVYEVRSHVDMEYLGDGQRTLKIAVAIVESSGLEGSGQPPGAASAGLTDQASEAVETARATTLPPISRQSSMESIQSGHRLSRHGSGLAFRGGSKPRGRSVYIPPQSVRVVGTSRSRRSRRLLDLDHAAPMARHSVTSENENTPQTKEHVFAFEAAPPDSPPGVHRLLRLGSGANRGNNLGGLRNRLFRAALTKKASRTSRIYAVTDEPEHKRTQDERGADPPRKVSPTDTQHTATVPMIHRRLRAIKIDGIPIPRRHQARVLEQTLQLLFACEVLLFAEYMEVVIPVLYALTLGGEWLTPNAKYNLVVASMSGAAVASQIWTSLLYALLELASMVAMYWVMKRKYGVSAVYQLAFVLERYWMTLQGKLVGSFMVVMNAMTIHQGAVAW